MHLRPLRWSIALFLLPQSLLHYVAAYDATPRWGQATVVVNGALFIFGGKTDEFNSYSYTSAPNTNDILYLSLTLPFTGASPDWQLVSSSANASNSQGPALAWHTLSAFNNTGVLLFGGQPGPNSPTVIVDQADSGALLDVFSRFDPTWILEPRSWGGEPVRRMRHSTATAPTGLVFVFGGEKADGSQSAFSDHFIFNPNSLSFALLNSTNAPPDIFGHVSIILSDGRILVFGGFCQSQGSLLSFSTIWVLDTTESTLQWTVIATDSSSLPSPRIAFAAVLIDGGRIIIHGGSDANLQTNFADGWILDTTKNPWTWTKVEPLTALGPRRDHFAVSWGGQVIFGFGYQNDAPAPAPLQIYDPAAGIWVPSYTPPPSSSQIPQTLPRPTQTQTSSSSVSGTGSGVHPTSTSDPNNPGGGSGGSPGDDDNDGSSKNTTAIAVGTAFGVLGLIAVGLGVAYYVRRQHQAREGERRFMALGGVDDDDDGGSPHLDGRIPAVRMHSVDGHAPTSHGILGTLGLSGALSAATKARRIRHNADQRRDMLADEDTRSFGEWYNARRRDGTGGSSWSLRSILGAGVRLRSRDGSTTSYGTGNLPTPWREKTDPFSDGASLMRDEETGFIGAAAVGAAGSRPHARREMSYASSRSGVSGYRDPFADPIQEEPRNEFNPSDLFLDEAPEPDPTRPSIRPVVPLRPLTTVVPLSHQAGHPLSPLSEHTSQSTLPIQNFSTSGSSQGHSNDHVPSPFDTISNATSLTSAEPTPPRSPGVTGSSIIGASNPALLGSNQPMRRSNSWWSRFSRSSLIDRRPSVGSRTGYDIRDPNPPPKLGPIEERSVISSADKTGSPHGSSPGSAGIEKQLQKKSSLSPQQKHSHPPSRASSMKVYGAGGPYGKSMSSLRTADSEAIERMAGTMDVVQRVKTRSQRGTGSMSSAGGLSIDTHAGSVSEAGERGSGSYEGSFVDGDGPEAALFTSPVDQEGSSAHPLEAPSHPLADLIDDPTPPGPVAAASSKAASSSPPRSDTTSSKSGAQSPSTNVSAKVREFERRMSLDQPSSPPPTNTKHKEERAKKRVEVNYGLVPRQSLYVANPDHRLSMSDDP